mgnify:CR=1 FL=1
MSKKLGIIVINPASIIRPDIIRFLIIDKSGMSLERRKTQNKENIKVLNIGKRRLFFFTTLFYIIIEDNANLKYH